MNISKWLVAGSVVAAAWLPFAASAQTTDPMAWPVSGMESAIHIAPSTVVADGAHDATITVYARDRYDKLLADREVQVLLLKGEDVIAQGDGTTDETGKAEFNIRSIDAGVIRVIAWIDHIQVSKNGFISFVDAEPCALASNLVVKLAGTQDERYAYYYGRDCKRHAFQDGAFRSWFGDISSAIDVGSPQIASMPLGGNVPFKPGSLIKFQSGNEVYAVSRAGVLRHIADEGAAVELFGEDWNHRITTISDAYYTNYEFGAEIAAAEDYDPDMEVIYTPTIGDNF